MQSVQISMWISGGNYGGWERPHPVAKASLARSGRIIGDLVTLNYDLGFIRNVGLAIRAIGNPFL